MATCKVHGYIVDGSENPIPGIKINFFPAALPAVNSSTGKGIYPISLNCVTSSTGYFSIDLIVNTDFIAVINSFGLKQKIRIPNESSKNLFELTGMYTSGDPTPSDPGSSETNW